jgi:diguanylate cyclase (GGDEF)-like protein
MVACWRHFRLTGQCFKMNGATLKGQRRSILRAYYISSTILFVIVLLFNSLGILGLKNTIQSIENSSEVIDIAHQIFDLIRSYGYERGRVNVILNYKGNRDDMKEFRSFTKRHREQSIKLFDDLAHNLSSRPKQINSILFQSLINSQSETEALRTAYLQAFEQPFSERNATLDDRWFNHMSRMIRSLNLLVYSLKESEPLEPELKQLIDILSLLAELRDEAGPAVSYLKATTFNRESLTLERIAELESRRQKVHQLVARLRFMGEIVLPEGLSAKIKTFEDFYLGQVQSIAAEIRINRHLTSHGDIDYKSFLEIGVQALEQLKILTDEIVTFIEDRVIEKMHVNLWLLLLAIALSLVILVGILANMRFIRQRIFKRISISAQAIKQLSLNHTDVMLPVPRVNDEIGDVEVGLKAFQNNLIALKQSNAKLAHLSRHDAMTRLLNHEAILQQLDNIHLEAQRYGVPYSLMMIDIDWFKKINDVYGHPIGDQILTQLAAHLTQHVRSSDFIGRYGGEEFLVILGHTELATAVDVAEKLCQSIASLGFSDNRLRITVSIGVASSQDGMKPAGIVARADEQLYRAKHLGRNRVMCEQHSP